jgi:hypothetical protein
MAEPPLADTVAYLERVGQGMLSVWFIAWSIRKSFGLDLTLTKRDQWVRWLTVAGCIAVTLLRGDTFRWARLAFGAVATSFFAWPNLGHHLARLFTRNRAELRDGDDVSVENHDSSTLE